MRTTGFADQQRGVMAPPRLLSQQGHGCSGPSITSDTALTNALLPLMEGRELARVVTVTSGARHFGAIGRDDLNGERARPLEGVLPSKLANVMFAIG